MYVAGRGCSVWFDGHFYLEAVEEVQGVLKMEAVEEVQGVLKMEEVEVAVPEGAGEVEGLIRQKEEEWVVEGWMV